MLTANHENGVSRIPSLMYGRVLMLGLGKGGLVPYILRNAVDELVIVERDPEVVAAYANTDKRVCIVTCDAKTYYEANKGAFNFIVQDIYEPVGDGRPWLWTDGWETQWVSL